MKANFKLITPALTPVEIYNVVNIPTPPNSPKWIGLHRFGLRIKYKRLSITEHEIRFEVDANFTEDNSDIELQFECPLSGKLTLDDNYNFTVQSDERQIEILLRPLKDVMEVAYKMAEDAKRQKAIISHAVYAKFTDEQLKAKLKYCKLELMEAPKQE